MIGDAFVFFTSVSKVQMFMWLVLR